LLLTVVAFVGAVQVQVVVEQVNPVPLKVKAPDVPLMLETPEEAAVTTLCTKASVAMSVLMSAVACVGAAGDPVKVGDANGA
jgi:hypothetical protein